MGVGKHGGQLSHVSRQCLGGRIAAKATLINQVQAWTPNGTRSMPKAHWQFTTDDARVKLKALPDSFNVTKLEMRLS